MKVSVVPVDGSHSPILIKSGEKVVLGRIQKCIRNTRVSRNQVELINESDVDPRIIIHYTGKHYGRLNDKVLRNGDRLEMGPSDVLCLLKDKFKYALSVESEVTEKRPKRKRNSQDECAKRFKQDSDVSPCNETSELSDEDEQEHLQNVNDKLQHLKQKFGATNLHNNTEGGDEVNPMTTKPVEKSFWHEGNRLLVYHSKGLLASDKVAGFDMDGTLITTQSGKVFPTSTSDWKFLLPEVPGRLKELHKNGYKVVIFSNQLGLSKGKVDVMEFRKKVENIIEKIGIPVQAYIASGPGIYRKPCSGMWNELEQQGNDGVKINRGKSFYIGDAAGRPKDWLPGKKKDFSCSDRLFAMNIEGIKFETPEEFFLGQRPAKFVLPGFDPKSISPDGRLLKNPKDRLVSGEKEIIVLVGYPASGKSHFVRNHLHPAGYLHVNRDTLGSWQKCVQKAREALGEGRSVIVDNTNPDKESRKRYVSLAKEMKVACRCFVMDTSLDHSRHNEKFREMTDKKHQVISDMIFNSYKSKFQEPNASEGFDGIVSVSVVPHFSDDRDKNLYYQHLLEK